MPTSQFKVRFSLKYNTLLVDNREGLKKPSRRKSTQILFQYHGIKVEYSLLRQLSLSPWRNGTSKGCLGENIFTKDFCSPILYKILSDNFDKSFQFRPSQYGVIPCSSRRWYRGEGLTARGALKTHHYFPKEKGAQNEILYHYWSLQSISLVGCFSQLSHSALYFLGSGGGAVNGDWET